MSQILTEAKQSLEAAATGQQEELVATQEAIAAIDKVLSYRVRRSEEKSLPATPAKIGRDMKAATAPKTEKGGRKNKTSQFFGVSRSKKNGRWRAQVWAKGALHHCGTFRSEINAAKAADAKLEELGLEPRNFPQDPKAK